MHTKQISLEDLFDLATNLSVKEAVFVVSTWQKFKKEISFAQLSLVRAITAAQKAYYWKESDSERSQMGSLLAKSISSSLNLSRKEKNLLCASLTAATTSILARPFAPYFVEEGKLAVLLLPWDLLERSF